MDTESARRPWTEPAIVALAFIAPGLSPSQAMPGPASAWLASGAIQSASQFALLAVIIGASGRLREYGARRPRLADVPRAAALFGLMALASRLAAIAAAFAGAGAAGGSAPGGPAAFIPPALNDQPALVVTLSALFALAVAYREELFYRLYVMGALRERGAGTAAAMIVSTTLFAAGHAWQGPAGILSALLVGAATAAAAARGWGLHALAAAHAAYDFFVLMAVFAY